MVGLQTLHEVMVQLCFLGNIYFLKRLFGLRPPSPELKILCFKTFGFGDFGDGAGMDIFRDHKFCQTFLFQIYLFS